MSVGAIAALPLITRAPRTISDAPETASPTARGAALDSFVRRKMDVAHTLGVSGLVTRGTDVVWSKGYGWADREAGVRADPDTVAILASISKTIIAAAAMQLWEQGSLDLDADVNGYLTFPVRNPNHPNKKITARMLMSHTSSIADRYSLWGTLGDPKPAGYTHGDATMTLHDLLEGYLVPGGPFYYPATNFYDERPGERYHYSNLGADVAALLVEQISGQLFSEFCKNNIFTPLGMTQTGHHLADISTPNLMMPYGYRPATGTYRPYYQYGYPDYPCGMVRTSANSLSRWMRCFMNHGILDGTRILKGSTVAEIRRPQIPGNSWQGMIFYYRSNHGNPLIGHSGGDYGVGTSMFFEAKASKPKGVIVLGNAYLASWKAWWASRDIEARLFEIA